ncbi:MAG TPA: group II intron reverse transcriptase/maturase [Geothermobacteraceae bacterium]|nr:group II intron reverse transcriptase/maturase [Geothermobacteraceae bacterium]
MAKIYYSLYDRMFQEKRLLQAFVKVKSNQGKPGIDGQTIEDFAEHRAEEIARLASELRDKSYRPLPVKRVEIPKGDGGKRLLGIPTVRDRIVQQALLNILQPIFDPEFHPSSYGYRPGRSPQQAVAKASAFIRRHQLKWVADMDLSRCFDTLNHDHILKSFCRKIADGSILDLLRMFLQSGVMIGERWQASEEGSPQGGVISPLIANIYLDDFDQFMKGRGYRIVRFADDILILTRSKSAAHNALNVARTYLERELLLTVNEQKSHVVHSSKGVKYLGVEIHTGYTRIKREKVREFKAKVKRITRRNSPVNLKKVITDLNPVVRGFASYFRIANCQREYRALMMWIRRRLRAKQLSLWKRAKRLHRRLRQLGYQGEFKAIKMNSWRNAASNLAHHAVPNSYFREEGLFAMDEVQTGYLPQNY